MIRYRGDRGEPHPEQPVELLVERVGAQGDGIAAYQGQPVYLPFTVPGDRVLALLGPRRGSGSEGRAIRWLTQGPERVEPRCRHFGTCGSCTLQHLDAASYQTLKLDSLGTALRRVGIDPAIVGPLRTVPPARRRARLGIARPHDPLLPTRIGYRERFRHVLVDLHECIVLEPALLAFATELRQVARDLVAPGEGAEATLTRTDSGLDVLIEAANPPLLGAIEALARLAKDCDLARIVWRTPGDEIAVVEHRPVRVSLSGSIVSYPPGAFLQASEAATAILVEQVVSGIGSARPALDLFAGLGTFAFALARSGPVHAVEGDERTAAALALAAAGQPQITTERRDLVRDPVPPDRLSRYAAAVFDPPRAGAARQAEGLAAAAIERVVAVSCNPATFARDAATLVAGGFRLESLTPVDQFVWTPHLELVGVFRR